MKLKQLFCKHENKILGEHVWTWEGKRYNEIFCDNCKKVLIPNWLWIKMEAYFNRASQETFNER
jgi:phage FluMu protein Com